VGNVQGNSLQGNLNELMEDVSAQRAELYSLRQMLQVGPVAELLSKRQAARILGIGRDTLRRLIDCQQLKTTPWMNGARISRDEIERLKRDGVNRAVALCLSSRKGRSTKKSQPSPPVSNPLTSWRHPSQRAG
jgi:hypothetical protein